MVTDYNLIWEGEFSIAPQYVKTTILKEYFDF